MNPEKLINRIKTRIKPVPCALEYLDGDCWEWQGTTCGPNGAYGQQYWQGRRQGAHRVVWKILVDPELPDDCDLDHLCGYERCVNPAHMDPVSHGVNMRRGNTLAAKNSFVTRCPKGHAYDAANTRHTASRGRVCRQCTRERSQRWREEHPGYDAACQRRYRERKRSASE